MTPDDNAWLVAAFTSLYSNAPVFLTYIAGFIVSLVNMSKETARAILTSIALAILFVSDIGFSFATFYLSFHHNGDSMKIIGMKMASLAVVHSFVRVSALVLFLVAIFYKR